MQRFGATSEQSWGTQAHPFCHSGLPAVQAKDVACGCGGQDGRIRSARSITASVSGSRITTGIVVITMKVEGEPDLFGTSSRVRVQLTEGNEPSSRLIGGDDVDPATGTVEVTTQQPRVVTLQITRNLQAGTNLSLDVIDAATGTRLSRSPVEVAADVTVEDDLG